MATFQEVHSTFIFITIAELLFYPLCIAVMGGILVLARGLYLRMALVGAAKANDRPRAYQIAAGINAQEGWFPFVKRMAKTYLLELGEAIAKHKSPPSLTITPSCLIVSKNGQVDIVLPKTNIFARNTSLRNVFADTPVQHVIATDEMVCGIDKDNNVWVYRLEDGNLKNIGKGYDLIQTPDGIIIAGMMDDGGEPKVDVSSGATTKLVTNASFDLSLLDGAFIDMRSDTEQPCNAVEIINTAAGVRTVAKNKGEEKK